MRNISINTSIHNIRISLERKRDNTIATKLSMGKFYPNFNRLIIKDSMLIRMKNNYLYYL